MEADERRKTAAALLRKGKLLEACATFTESLASSPADLRAPAYAGRSSVLVASGHLQQSISDAQRALASGGYPELLRYKLHLQVARCWKALGQMDRAEKSLREAVELIEAAQVLSEEKRVVLKEETAREFQAPLDHGQPLWVQYSQVPKLSHGPREDLGCLSRAVEVRSDLEFGRHLVAARDINTGDVLLVEKPTVSFLLETENFEKGNKEAIWTHCSHCFKMSLDLEPCDSCKWALYCSLECKEQAWTEYHKRECRIRRKYETLRLASDPESTASWVRIMTKFLATWTPTEDKDDDILKLLPDVYPDEKMERVTRLAKKMSEAGCEGLGDEERSRAADLCVRVLLAFQRNSYTIDETHFVPSIDAFRKSHVIGRGLYATVALLNHSCDANTTRSFHPQATQVVRAARPIRWGEQIFAGYGPDYGGMPRVARRETLRKKFFFECACEACDNDWPLVTSNLGFVPAFLRQPPHLQLLREVVQTVIATKTFQGRCYSTVAENEEIFQKCIALQKLYFENDAPRSDWIYYFTEKFILNHLDVTSKKLVASPGEPYLSAYDEDSIFA